MKKDDFYEEDTFIDEIFYEDEEESYHNEEDDDFDDKEYSDNDFDDEEGDGLQILVRVLGVLVAVAILAVVGIFAWQSIKTRTAADTAAFSTAGPEPTPKPEVSPSLLPEPTPKPEASPSPLPEPTPKPEASPSPLPEPTPKPTEVPTSSPETSVSQTSAAAVSPSPKPDAAMTSAPERDESDTAPTDIVFSDVSETVTAKDRTNLRDKPSQGNDSNVIYVLSNGETLQRMGVSESGWSRLSFDGKICYAVSSYLTTDLSPKPTPEPDEDDGLNTKFTRTDEQVTPKIEVNLRKLPSVTNPAAEVVVTVRKGTVLHRTGINSDVGWSRISYDGQTLYCISSYVEAYTEE